MEEVVENLLKKYNCNNNTVSRIVNIVILYAKSTLYPELFTKEECNALREITKTYF